MELTGKPTITLSHDVFERAAKAQAKALGIANLPLIIEPSPKQGNLTSNPEELRERATQEAIDALTEAPSDP